MSTILVEKTTAYGKSEALCHVVTGAQQPVDVLGHMDFQIQTLKERLVIHRKRANTAALKKGERQITADRICDWTEHRIKVMTTARDAMADLIKAVRAELETEDDNGAARERLAVALAHCGGSS